jgi:hypothetical protein
MPKNLSMRDREKAMLRCGLWVLRDGSWLVGLVVLRAWAVRVLEREVALLVGQQTNKYIFSLVEGEGGYYTCTNISPSNPKSTTPPEGLDAGRVAVDEANEAMVVGACFVAD